MFLKHYEKESLKSKKNLKRLLKRKKNLCKNLRSKRYLFETILMKGYDSTNLRKFKPQMRGRRLHLEKTIKSLWFKENLIKFKNQNN